MTNLLIIYLAAVVVPPFFASWRVAVFGLAFQGLMVSLILLAGHDVQSPLVIVEFACLMLIRVVFVPWYLLRKSTPEFTQRSFTLVGINLWERTLVACLTLVGFAAALTISSGNARESIQIGTVATSLLVGMLMVANQRQPRAQLVGLFTFESGIKLLELLSHHTMPIPIQIGLTVISVFFVLTLGQYLSRFSEIVPPDNTSEREIV